MSLIDGAAAVIAQQATEQTTVRADAPDWKQAKNGRYFTRVPGVKGWGGIVWREGPDETVAQAIARKLASGTSDPPPRSKKTRKMEDRPNVTPINTAPKGEVTRQIAEMLTDILCMPAMPCMAFGMEWEANHFTVQGERFAYTIAKSSERNPWLRKKLESGLAGEQTAIAWITSLNLITGAVGYVFPLLLKWGMVPGSDMTKAMFGVPVPHRQSAPQQAAPYHGPSVVEQVQMVTEMFQRMEDAKQSEVSESEPDDGGIGVSESG